MSDIVQIIDEDYRILGHISPKTADQPARLVSIEAVAIIEAARDLLAELDTHAKDKEPSPGQRAYMERLRAALAE